MKIGTKIIAVLAPLIVVLICLGLVVERQVLTPSFAALERDEAVTSMRRVDYALNATLESLELTATDWGNWADVYHFIESPTQEFVSANITTIAMKQLQINALMIVDPWGRVLLASARDLETGAPLDLELCSAETLPEGFPWRHSVVDGRPAKGLLRTNLGIMEIAAAPVLDGSGGGRSLGMVLMGRLLTAAQLQHIGAQAAVQLALMADPGPELAGLVETATTTRVFRSFQDVYGRPLLTLQVDLPRRITARGQSAVRYASLYMIAAGVIAMLLLLFLLKRIVLTPLARVTRHAVVIGEGVDLSARLNLPGTDEVAVLAREFDRMVGRVAESRRLLVDQSFQAGFAELAKGVLHNLGNALTPLGARLTKLADGLRDAPMADIELAVTELAGETAGSRRHADLQEFLRLASRQLHGTILAAKGDVNVMQRQAAVVQAALSELVDSTRHEPVIEPVRLPELVLQTLEIVPDSCRQRLVVEADDSLQRIGVVQVSRTIVRLVLQNLIINAADAVRDAGRAQGVLRVAAEIVREAGRDQLHLRCDDDGIGIAKQDLERVFEQGFSTKSRDSNQGVGLHWSANAIAALGGRLWADSPGRGLGASLHLMLPL